ncbi:MAG: hypothetical protein SGI97_01995 [candidate division Zixibacteria bacterium]|nr:hypothetical protein [candidate division Zixibacteria bacterium]
MGAIKTLARHILPRTAKMRIYRRQALDYIESLRADYEPAKKTILVINHFFDQDIKALRAANTKYNIVVVEAPILFKGAKLFFAQGVQDMTASYDLEDPMRVQEYHAECELMFSALKDRFNPALMVAVNDNFYWIREFIRVGWTHDVKTVVIDKEGTISPHSFEHEVIRAKKCAPFMSDHIFVWSERQKEFWKRIGVTDDKLTVLGQPRSDLFYQKMDFTVDNLFTKPQPLITLFSYDDAAYIPIELVASENLTWRKMKHECHHYLYEMAKSNPTYNFVYKTHPQQLDFTELKAKYELPNLKVVGGSAIANELIVRSELIIAFQTTAMLEAMFLGKRLIYTSWDPHVPRLTEHILPFHTAEGIVISESFAHFQAACNRFVSGDISDFVFTKDQVAQRNRLVQEYLYQPDGHVCDRFFSEIERFMV